MRSSRSYTPAGWRRGHQPPVCACISHRTIQACTLYGSKRRACLPRHSHASTSHDWCRSTVWPAGHMNTPTDRAVHQGIAELGPVNGAQPHKLVSFRRLGHHILILEHAHIKVIGANLRMAIAVAYSAIKLVGTAIICAGRPGPCSPSQPSACADFVMRADAHMMQDGGSSVSACTSCEYC